MKHRFVRRVSALALAGCLLAGSSLPAFAAASAAKEEVNYANLTASGAVTGVYAVNSCSVQAGDTVADHGSYTAVRNMTTSDAVEQSGDTVTVHVTEDGKLYYEGTMDAATALPRVVKLTYTLDGGNYGDFLLKTIESAKDQFSADELKLLQGEAEKIRDIENKLTMLEEKYPNIIQKSVDGDINMPTDDNMNMTPDDGSMQKFPAFEGKDLDGNDVKSDELFSGNAVTVVNFWFTTCGPCVGELAELDALNNELAEKGGTLIGINAFTLDGNEAAISDAKDVLTQSGATYQNVYFDSGSEAGKFVESIYAYPTTYVVDRSGRIVGDPIVGAITSKAQADALQAQIDKSLAADMG